MTATATPPETPAAQTRREVTFEDWKAAVLAEAESAPTQGAWHLRDAPGLHPPVEIEVRGPRLRLTLSLTTVEAEPVLPVVALVAEHIKTPIRQAVLERLRTSGAVARHGRIRQQQEAAAKERELLQARIEELTAKRKRVALEAGKGMAKELTSIDASLAEARPKLAEAEQAVNVLAGELRGAEQAIENEYQAAFREARHKARDRLMAQRDDARFRLLAVPELRRLVEAEFLSSAC